MVLEALERLYFFFSQCNKITINNYYVNACRAFEDFPLNYCVLSIYYFNCKNIVTISINNELTTNCINRIVYERQPKFDEKLCKNHLKLYSFMYSLFN